MKVDPKLLESVDLKKPFEKKASAASSASVAPVGASKVRLSEISTTLHSLEAKLSAEPAFDAKRVDEIKAAIRDGQFKVNPEAIADRLISSVREWVGQP